MASSTVELATNLNHPQETLAMKLYVAGPMRGHTLYNFPAFFQAAMALREMGYTVFNPAERDMAQGMNPSLPLDDPYNLTVFSLSEAFEWDLARVAESDGIVLLPGWRKSKGTQVELSTAITMGKEVFIFVNGALKEIFFEGFHTKFSMVQRKPEKDGWNKPKEITDPHIQLDAFGPSICGEEAKPRARLHLDALEEGGLIGDSVGKDKV